MIGAFGLMETIRCDVGVVERRKNGHYKLLSLLSPFTRLSGVYTREFARARIHG